VSGSRREPGLTPGVTPLATRRGAMLTPSRARVAPSARSMARRRGFVQAVKYLLPGAALILIALILFWQDIEGKDGRLSFRRGTGMEPAALQVTNPLYQGRDELNRPYTVTANLARQAEGHLEPGQEVINLTAPRADITLNDGAWILLESRDGVYDRGRNLLDLAGDVTVYHDNGTRFQSDTAHVDLTAGTAQGDRPTQAQGPFGTIVSEGFEIQERGAVVVFTGRAHAVLEGTQR
jgi:lipopolysaccharide export system protein LptC